MVSLIILIIIATFTPGLLGSSACILILLEQKVMGLLVAIVSYIRGVDNFFHVGGLISLRASEHIYL